jgi:hypothetical protein
MFCAPRLFLGGTEGVGARFHVLRSRTLFGRCRGRRVLFSCFALLDPFWAVPRVSGPVFMFCASGNIFDGTEGVVSSSHVLHFRTRFQRYRERRVLSSCFVLSDSFWASPRASSPIFMFCAPEHVFGGTEGVGSRFHVLRSRTGFGRYRGRRVPFSSFALPDSFTTVPRASGLIFMFCALALVMGGTGGAKSDFHVLRSRTRFGRNRRCRVLFSCLALPDSFGAVPIARGPVFMFCAPSLFLGGTEAVRSRFHILRARTHFLALPRASIPFSCFARPNSFFDSTEVVGARFHVLRSLTLIWRYRGRRAPFSCFALPDLFSMVPRLSGLIFMFCAPGLFLGGTEAVGARFHVLHSRTLFGRYRGRQGPFLCFALPDSFRAILKASEIVFNFCTP